MKKLVKVILALAALAIGFWVVKAWLFPEILRPRPEVLISLRELPGISGDTLAAQGSLFKIQEPFLYDRSTKMAVFVTEILSSKNFGDETHVIIGGDARSLECFRNEIQFVNNGPRRASMVGGGVVEGVVSLVEGLWQLVRHPVDSVGGLAAAIKNSGHYLYGTNTSDMTNDAVRLAKAFYCNKASETAEEHHLDYFDLKTQHGKDALHSEVNAQLAGRGGMELALLLVPFSEAKYGAEAAEVSKVVDATKAAEAASVAEKMAEAGQIPTEAVEFAKAGRLFPKMVEKMIETMKRLKSAVPTTRFRVPFAKLGKAVSTDYRATFLAANKEIDAANVVVHHAVEQQVLTRYPGVVTEAEIHSLENLRGIPKALDATLHKAEIAKEWNEFYRLNPAATMTKAKLLQKATEIDRKFGHLFTPKLL